MSISIIDRQYRWNGELQKRSKTDYIILHHAKAAVCSPEDIHRWHLNNGWVGMGYQYFTRKDGTIYRGRPEDTVGAHTVNYNSSSIGICFEGDFENERMPEAQEKAGIELVRYLLSKYPNAKVIRHCDVNNTRCPGENFPNRIIIEGMKPEEEVNPVNVVAKALGLNSPDYWEQHPDKYVHVLIKKMADYIKAHG